MDGQESEDAKQSTADMAAYVQNLLELMQTRFQAMSDSIVSKTDDIGNKIGELEQSINDLKAEMRVEATSVSKPDEPKPPSESA